MENENLPWTFSDRHKYILGGMALIALLAVFYYTSSTRQEEIAENALSRQVATISVTPTTVSQGTYKNGTYSVTGNYMSPGGSESIEVKLTIKDNVITDSQVVGDAVRPQSKKYQAQFISGYKQFVTGKKISEVVLDKVSGSSLTPKGFNDAIEKIKKEASV